MYSRESYLGSVFTCLPVPTAVSGRTPINVPSITARDEPKESRTLFLEIFVSLYPQAVIDDCLVVPLHPLVLDRQRVVQPPPVLEISRRRQGLCRTRETQFKKRGEGQVCLFLHVNGLPTELYRGKNPAQSNPYISPVTIIEPETVHFVVYSTRQQLRVPYCGKSIL